MRRSSARDLGLLKVRLGSPLTALSFSLFGEPHHDATALAREFGLAAAGFFCNGELGPVGGRNCIHGFTASIAFFVPITA